VDLRVEEEVVLLGVVVWAVEEIEVLVALVGGDYCVNIRLIFNLHSFFRLC
jgi:hypothetical protein